jgi:heme exporter protein D
MILELLTINGQGIFVWLSFSITILACVVVYFKTLRTLKKHEREFASEFEKLSHAEKQTVKARSKVVAQVLFSQNKTI